MRLMYQWLGAEIVFVHVGHGLLGAGVVVVLALHLPWWFTLGLVPVVLFSVWGWFQEASLVMPVARRYLSGDPFPVAGTAGSAGSSPPPRPAGRTPFAPRVRRDGDAAATTRPGDAGPSEEGGASGRADGGAPPPRPGQVKTLTPGEIQQNEEIPWSNRKS